MKKIINIILLIVAVFLVASVYTNFIKPKNEAAPNTSNSTTQNEPLLNQLADSIKTGSVDALGEQLIQKIGNSDPKELLAVFNAIPEDKRNQIISYFTSHLNNTKDAAIIGVFEKLKSDPNLSKEESMILDKILASYKETQ